MLSLNDVSFSGKVALIRSDLNVPIENGVIKDSTRIVRSLPSLKHVIDKGGVCTIMSHLGRPKSYDKEFSLAPVAAELESLLGMPVILLDSFDAKRNLTSDNVYLYENTRFFSGETNNDIALAKDMGSCCDIYIMDAFASSHRKHASTYGVMDFAPISCAGVLFSDEIKNISQVFNSPIRPMVAVIGGAKISSKIGLLDSLLDVVDILVIVGGMANTFLKSSGCNIGKSLCEDDQLEVARKLKEKATENGVVIYLPQDFIIANDSKKIQSFNKNIKDVESEDVIFDVGDATLKSLEAIVSKSGLILWNGPLGMFENKLYAKGSVEFARLVTSSSAVTIVGGGDTLRVINETNLLSKVSYASTGGGAFLDFLGNRTLPSLEKLTQEE